MSAKTLCENREPPGTALRFAVESGRNLPKICTQPEEKVKCVYFCRIRMFNYTKILYEKLAI